MATVLPPSDAHSRERFEVAFGVGLPAFLLYLFCLSPTVTYGGDCGELIAASYRLGIAHPTGYAFYCLLGRTFASLLPFGEVAWRYNLLSALCGALAVSLVANAVHRVASAFPGADSRPQVRVVSSAGAAALLAGFYYFASQCVIAEVYSLNALMLSGLLVCAIAWHQTADFRWSYSCALLLGLALNAHLSCIFLVPGLLLYVLWQHRDRFSHGGGFNFHLARMLALFAAAYALTVYLPLRSMGFPDARISPHGEWWPLDWSHPVDLSRWYLHISAQQYKSKLLRSYLIVIAGHDFHFTWFSQPWSITLSKLISVATFVALQLWWCIALVAIGFIASWKRASTAALTHERRWLATMLTLTGFFNVGLEIHYEVGDLQNFFFPAYIAMAVFVGLGAAHFMTWMANRHEARPQRAVEIRPPSRQRQLPPAGHQAFGAGLFIGSACLCQWTIFGPQLVHRNDIRARTAALQRATIIEKLAKDTGQTPHAVIPSDDALWGFWYAHYVLGRAPQCHTPWGPYRTDALKSGKLVNLVDEWQRTGPVVLSQWDDATDAKYPLVMLSLDGKTSLASHRVLPPPATIDPNQTGYLHSTPPTSVELTSGSFYSSEPVHSRTTAADIPAETTLVHVKRGDNAAFNLRFSMTNPTPVAPLPGGPPVIDRAAPGSFQVGYLEVLLVRKGALGTPKTDQTDIRRENTRTPPLVAWRQFRRLVVPLSTLQKSARYSNVKASVPLLLDPDSAVSVHNVWARITRSKNDKTTSWHKLNDVVVSDG